MKKVLSIVLAAMMVLGCVFVLASCGDEKTEVADTTAAENNETAENTENTDVEKIEDVAYITEKGTLVVGITEYKPMDYKENGEWTGFDAEYATLVAEKLGVDVEFFEVDWDNKVFELNDKKVDCIWNGMTIKEELKKSMDITDPYVKNAQVVVMKKENLEKYADAESIADLKFAVEAGSAAESLAEENEYANVVALSVQADAILEVSSGKADAAIIDKTMAEAMTGEGKGYEDLGFSIVLNDEVYGVGCRKGSDLCDKINEITKELTADGTLAALAEKYGLSLAD